MQAETDTLAPGTDRRFFRPIDWSAFWTACLAAFAVYFYTLAPTVTLEDSGELAVAGDYMGVPHPPGYPIWSLLAWVFARLFSFVTFRGQPNPGWSIALFSAVFGALATGVSAMLICRSGSDILRRSRDVGSHTDRRTDNLICWVGGVAASLVFAFSPVMWSQAVIVEVYALNAFFLVLIFLLVYMWICRPSDRILFVTAFVFGLGLTNYQVLLLAALALVVALIVRDLDLFRDFAVTGAPFVIVLALIQRGVLPAIDHPTHPTCFVYLFLNFLTLGLAFCFLPRGRTVAISLLLVELGIAFYAYMPIVSDLRNPPMNWGYPRTWEGFQHAITRGQYERIEPTDVFSMHFIHQVGFYLTDLRRQFYLPIALLGFLPFTTWRIRFGERRINALSIAISLCVLASLVATLEKLFLPAALRAAMPLDKILVLGVIVLLVIGGLTLLIAQTRELILKFRGRLPATPSQRGAIGVVLAGGILLYLFYVKMLIVKIAEITAPLREAGGALPSGRLGVLFLQAVSLVLMVVGPPLLVWLLVRLMRGPARLEMTIDDRSQKWVTATLFGFLTMSVVLIALANFKLDIQDTFIQRVKLISSHALYAFWMGYGLIFGLAFLDTLFRGNRLVKWLGLGGALVLLPLAPLAKNAFDQQLIKEYGGAEQNGHDFGWQFGNYQLRGADAISEELAPDEEPLPNPGFPPAMTPDAIFFGGTDPGRFVPTYMIYSARVREDVYLITQNALADNTYMAVMRDLYGDRIWIPAQPDSARAFQQYVDDLKAGRAPKNADVNIENGRVQVSGALGVMEINGILCRMIFDKNNYRHDFYVEESYVIRWMYPYLTPHGLIMKINRNPADLTRDTVRDDQDFWDWYSRRLNADWRFRRDVVARKSFSKLRSAIGGLYASRGMFDHAEQAFQQARLLYHLSPEANFRLCQEVLVRQSRFTDAARIMAEFEAEDPGNAKAGDFLRQLRALQDVSRTIDTLEARMQEGKLDMNEALRLLDLYTDAGQVPKFNALAGSLLAQTNLPPIYQFRLAQLYHSVNERDKMVRALDLCADRIPSEAPPQVLLDIARLYASARETAKMKTPLVKYLERRPQDWKAWLDLATVQLSLKQTNEAGRAVEQAVRVGGNQALSTIRQNPHLSRVHQRALSRTRNLIGIP